MIFRSLFVLFLTVMIADLSQGVRNHKQSHLQGVNEGCGECGRPLGAPCGHEMGAHCRRGLTCRYHTRNAPLGVCKVPAYKGCLIGTRFFKHGEQFSLDCRTQCICQNGTYACSTRCPNENISPKGSCSRPKLIDLPGHCCRQWLCEAPVATDPPKCMEKSSVWSECTSFCGGGLSFRTSNTNPTCRARQESRLCQKKACIRNDPEDYELVHFRRKHSCKATQRMSGVYLRLGPCVSRKRYAPRHCGPCPQTDVCCRATHSTTIRVEMKCHNFPMQGFDEETEDVNAFLLSFLMPGEDIWLPLTTRTSYNMKEFNNIRDVPNHNQSMPLTGDFSNTYVVKVEKILKCKCGKDLCKGNKRAHHNKNRPMKILSRVHRTA